MQFLIEGRIKILAQEITGQTQAFQGLPRRLAVPVSDHVGATGGQLPQGQPDGCCSQEQQADKDPIGRFAHEETFVLTQGSLCLDEADILAEIPYALAVHGQGAGAVLDGLAARRGAPFHSEMKRIR